MIKSRTQKTYYNIIASGIYEIVGLLNVLIIPRFILNAFGSSDNGLLSSITQFLDYISILCIGIGGPTRFALYKSLSKNDMKKTSEILKATNLLYKKFSIVFLIYMIVLAVAFPLVLKRQQQWLETSCLVIVIGIGIWAEYCFGMTFSCLVNADQCGYIYTSIKIVCKILNTFVSIMLIYAGASLLLVKLGSAVLYVLQPLTLNYIVHKKYKIYKNVTPDNTALKQRGDAAASSIANLFHDRTDIAVLTLFCGTLVVSVYSVYMMVMNGLNSIMRVFTGSLEAPFGNLWAKQDIQGIRKNLRVYEFFVYSFVVVIFSCTGVLIMPFISLYTNVVSDINYIIPSFAVLTVLASAIYCIRQPYVTIVQAAGKYKETKTANFIEAGLNIGISIILVFKLGLIGVTVGTLIADLYRTIVYARYVSKHLIFRSIRIVVQRMVWALSTAAIIVLICLLVPNLINYGSWSEWIISGIKCFIISITITLSMAIIFYKKDVVTAGLIVKNAHMITNS